MFALITMAMGECSPVRSVGNRLNLTEFTAHTWFIQEQQLTGYQPVESLFCVTATYDLNEARRVPFFGGKVISVHNYANYGGVNGPNQNKNNMTLCGRATNSEDTSKLSVAPCWLPNYFAGPYWVIGLADDYRWAVIIGGQPTERCADGCTTREDGVYNSGLWLFTRAQNATKEELAEMHQLLKAKGVARSRLLPVEHR